MVAEPKNEYNPDYVSPPGDTLAEVLESRSMAQNELAERTGRTPKLINEIIKGKAPIVPETAIQLERVLSIPASFWNNRQRRFDEFLAQKKEKEKLNQNLRWPMLFPYNKMAKLHWVPDSKDRLERLRSLLNFFGVASPQSWDQHWENIQVSFRKSDTHKPNKYALAAWLRRGEQIGLEIPCKKYNEDKFRESLKKIRSYTTLPAVEFQPKVKDICAKSGVAVAFVPELPKTASGVTKWLSSEKALIQLSLKYKTDDHLWFTFFHEAAHILFHHKKNIFIESSTWKSKDESEANDFAEKFLIPTKELEKFISKPPISKQNIRIFASNLGIAPGIVVGQLQKKKHLLWEHCNDLKRKLRWSLPH